MWRQDRTRLSDEPVFSVKYEIDAIDGPTLDIWVNVPSNGGFFTYKHGGNGLKPGEDPFWDVYDPFTGALHRHGHGKPDRQQLRVEREKLHLHFRLFFY